MAIDDKAYSVNMSLRQSHLDKIKSLKKTNPKRFSSDASAIQHIIDSYFVKTKKIVFTHIGYPIIITILMWYVTISTSNLNGILVEKGFYFNELYLQYNIFLVIGIFWVNITAISFWVCYKKLKSE